MFILFQYVADEISNGNYQQLMLKLYSFNQKLYLRYFKVVIITVVEIIIILIIIIIRYTRIKKKMHFQAYEAYQYHIKAFEN